MLKLWVSLNPSESVAERLTGCVPASAAAGVQPTMPVLVSMVMAAGPLSMA